MKKLFLFTMLSALAISFNSCSDDDSSSNSNDSKGGSFTFKVDGSEKTFKTVSVLEEDVTDSDQTRLIVTGADNVQNMASFEVYEGDLGEDAVGVATYFQFTLAGDTFYVDANEFSTNVIENNGKRVKGTFSGPIHSITNGATVRTVTDGKFDVRY